MDEFFQNLREIQKKERSLSGLAPVGENFYQDVSKYFNGLMRKIDNNPFSFESYLLRDAQRIIAEICERREHKISNSAVMNVQRSHQLFKESKSDSRVNSPMQVPRNSTPEEEKLYRALAASLVTYREKMRGPLRFYSNQGQKDQIQPESLLESSNKTEDSNKTDKPHNINKNSLTGPLKNEGRANGNDDKLNRNDERLSKEIDEILGSEDGSNSVAIYKRFGAEPGQGQPKESKDKQRDKQALKSTNSQEDTTEVLMILDELPSIMGVDNKVYGPLSPQDIITMPQPNARILIKNQKGISIHRYK